VSLDPGFEIQEPRKVAVLEITINGVTFNPQAPTVSAFGLEAETATSTN
jgi:hypothetical protein